MRYYILKERKSNRVACRELWISDKDPTNSSGVTLVFNDKESAKRYRKYQLSDGKAKWKLVKATIECGQLL